MGGKAGPGRQYIRTSYLVLCISEIIQYDPGSLESKGMWLITALHTETIH